jgi:hypothetical protein
LAYKWPTGSVLLIYRNSMAQHDDGFYTPPCPPGRVEEWRHALRSDLSGAPRFLWVGIELGRASLEGGGLPSSPFRSARRGHNSTKAASLVDGVVAGPSSRGIATDSLPSGSWSCIDAVRRPVLHASPKDFRVMRGSRTSR